jgi:hypothetical protein
MAWFDFFWYEQNIQHLAEHGVTTEEFEEAVMSARQIDVSDSGSNMVRGRTSQGRFLCCIFDRIDDVAILPITAYEPTKGTE